MLQTVWLLFPPVQFVTEIALRRNSGKILQYYTNIKL